LCGREESRVFLTKGGLRLARCGSCAVVFADPVPAELVSGAFYRRSGYALLPDKLESDYAPSRFERELRLFRRWCRGGRVLDVGCASGAFLHQLKTRWPGEYVVSGTDLASAALDCAERHGVEVLRQDFLELRPEGAGFDAITFWAVIEHLLEPRRFLRQGAALLRPGGVCFLLVPNLGSLAVRLLGPRYRYFMPEHVTWFTAATLRAFARSEPALELATLRSTHFNPAVIWQDWRRRGEPVPEAERARLLRRTTTWKQRPALRPVKVLYDAVERVLGWLRLADNLVLVLRKRPVPEPTVPGSAGVAARPPAG
jgi:2-polyprenyl-3-methyl-5-hydroxy-6-metoxy-1,4-benzoquinol methylase